MEIKTLVDIKTSKGWREAGSILEMNDNDAKRLVDLNAATKYVEDPATEIVGGISELDGVEDNFLEELLATEFNTVETLANATVEDLTPVNGIGKKTAEKIIESAKKSIDNE